MLQLAKECKHLSVFTHISTAYVNCNRTGYIEEKIYDDHLDQEAIVKSIMAKNDKEVHDNEKKIIGEFPNTYTFTKNLAEKQLRKNLGNVKCVIWRPSIIASGLKQPFPGWTDSMSAAGGLTVLGGLGLIQLVHKPKENNVFDIIPVDIVSNGLLCATADASSSAQRLTIYNSATSVQNPITLEDYKDIVLNFYKFYALRNQQYTANARFIKSKFQYELRKELTERLPIRAFSLLANLPFASPSFKKKV